MAIQNESFWRHWQNGEFDKALACSAEEQKQPENRLQLMLFGSKEQVKQTVAVTTISAGEFLYDYIMINPDVVQGIDFARTEDLSSLFTLSQFSEQIDTTVLTGDMAQLQGYVAEQMLAAELQAKGHDVEFPQDANNPGWDILVDGQAFQVKNLALPAGVREHLEKYPDIPVYVNEELAPYFEGHPSVYVSEISREEVLEATTTTITHAADLLDFEIPWISAGVSSFYNIRRVWKDDVTINQAVLNVVSDTSSRFLLGALGQKTGIVLGTMIFGPAGGITGAMFGSFAGVSQGGRLSTGIKRTFSKQKEKELLLAVEKLVLRLGYAIDEKIAIKSRKHEQLLENLVGSEADLAIGDVAKKRHDEDVRYILNKKEELQAMMVALRSGKKYVIDALPHMLTLLAKSGVHAVHFQKELVEVQERAKEYMKRT